MLQNVTDNPIRVKSLVLKRGQKGVVLHWADPLCGDYYRLLERISQHRKYPRNELYSHLTVNHQQNFVDPTTGAHIPTRWKGCGALPSSDRNFATDFTIPIHRLIFLWLYVQTPPSWCSFRGSSGHFQIVSTQFIVVQCCIDQLKLDLGLIIIIFNWRGNFL